MWQLTTAGIDRIVISCGYRGDMIRAYFGDGGRWNAEIRYADEDEPLGTGGAVRLAAALVEDDPFLLLNGDSICEVDIPSLLAAVSTRPELLGAMTLVTVSDGGRYGGVELRDGLVASFRQNDGRGGPGLVNAGVYALRRALVDRIPDGPSSLERDLLPSLPGRIAGLVARGFFVDMGLPETYRQICEDPAPLRNVVGRGGVR